MICKDDIVIRMRGTAQGFRVGTEATVVSASKSHIVVRNDDGVVREFRAKDWELIHAKHRERTVYLVMGIQADTRLFHKTYNIAFAAGQGAEELIANGGRVIAKKKLTIPYNIGEVA